VSGPGDVPEGILARLRPICLGLPEAYEEPAWNGTRWRIRARTFAHVVTIEPDRHPHLAEPAQAERAVCAMQFRAYGEEMAALVGSGLPFYRPGWGVDVVGILLGPRTDWAEVAELLTDSYTKLAPRKLAALVSHPPAPV